MAVYQYVCASPVCRTTLNALSRARLTELMTEHLRTDHLIARPSRPIVTFLTQNAVSRVGAVSGGSA